MQSLHLFAFLVFPYIVLTAFVLGHLYRYLTDLYSWNARSSEFLDKRYVRLSITLFHWGIILTLLGHAGGLLIPQTLYDMVGITGQIHTQLAIVVGFFVGAAAFIGLILIMVRRLRSPRISAVNTVNHWITLALLLTAIGTGLYNVIFGHFYVLDTVAPWIRRIIILAPDETLMEAVPLSYKIHIISGLTLIGYSAFTRLIHIWSAPLVYLFRSYVLFRRRVPEGEG